jgi:exodeoxyribonuclease-3
MRIDLLLGTAPVAARLVAAEIDREARKGKLPSDHAPLVVDLDEPGAPLGVDWEAAEARRKARMRPR